MRWVSSHVILGLSLEYLMSNMLLQDKQSGALIEILDVSELINPVKQTVAGRIQSGQEEQDPENLDKANLSFPSGESLPRCWLDADYQLQDT